jgi:hypothetical protein
VKKVKIQDSMGKINFFLSTCPSALGAVSATWLHVGVPQKIQEKMNLIPVINKTSPRVHTEWELGVLGDPGKLVKYVVHSSKRKN